MRIIPRRRLALVTAAAAFSSTHPPAAGAIGQSQVYFPLSWTGRWSVERTLDSINGDAAAADFAWRALGGSGEFVSGHTERYEHAFVLDEREQASVADARTELSSRNSQGTGHAAEVQLTSRGPTLRYKRQTDRDWTELLLISETSLRTLSSYGTIERWVVQSGGGQQRQQQQQLVVEMSRSYRPINAQGFIVGRETISTYDASGDLPEQPSSTSRSSLTLRPTFRPLSDPVSRQQAAGVNDAK